MVGAVYQTRSFASTSCTCSVLLVSIPCGAPPGRVLGVAAFEDRAARARDQVQVVREVVQRRQAREQDLAAGVQVAQVRAREAAAGLALARVVDGSDVLAMARV